MNRKPGARRPARQRLTSPLPPPGTTDKSSVATGTGEDAGPEIKECQAIMDQLCDLPVKTKGKFPLIPLYERAIEVPTIKVG